MLHLSRLLVNRIEPSKRTCDQASRLQLSGPRRLVAGQAGYVVTTIAQATRLTIQRSSRSLRTFNCEASHCFFRPSPPKDERGPEALHPHPSLRWAVLGARPYCHGEGWQKVGVGRGRAVASDSGRLLKWALLKWTLPSSHSLVCHGQVVAHRKRQGTKCCMRDLAASPCALVFLSLLFKPRAPTLYLFELPSKTLSSAEAPGAAGVGVCALAVLAGHPWSARRGRARSLGVSEECALRTARSTSASALLLKAVCDGIPSSDPSSGQLQSKR